MSAAIASINTQEQKGAIVTLPIEAATTVFVGTMGAVNAAGNAVPAADAAGLRVVGRCEGTTGPGLSEQDCVNPGAAGAISGNFKRGAFVWNNSQGDPVVAADIGKVVYVQDDNTVNHTGGTNHIKAGIFLGFALIDLAPDPTRCLIDTHSAITG